MIFPQSYAMLFFSEFRRILDWSERSAVVCLPIAAGLLIVLSAASAPAESRKNVLFVVFDDLNMDIGAYGNKQVKTPYLDAFAKQAVRFDHAHCNGPYCAPSRASFISGLYPSTTGIYGGERYYEIEATKNLVSMFAHFNAHDYDYYRAYLACISFADAEFGKLLDALEQSGQADNTIVIVTSDHGYHFGDKLRIGKGSPWNGTTQVPLLVRVPGMTRSGSVCKQPVSLVDLYPTLIDLCSFSENPHGEEFPLDGHSIKPLLGNVDATWDGPSVAYNNCYSKAWTVCDSQYRYILDPDGNEELYDLRIDPNEWHNLAKQDSSAAIRIDMKNKLLELSRGKRPVHQ